jgi:peptidoglycan LD-endopeptidase CwlK
MPALGSESRAALNTCDTRLTQVAEKVVKIMDFKVLEGHRNKEKQNAAFEGGKSTIKWPDGKHNKNPSLAFDVAPWPIDWNDEQRFILLAGLMIGVAWTLGIKLRWGGDWKGAFDPKNNKFKDLGHFELVD